MAEATLDQFLDALECVLGARLDPWGEDDNALSSRAQTDRLVLGRCTADGYAMYRDSETGFTCRPSSVGRGVPCPADGRTYPTANGVGYMGLCQAATFEPWKAGKR